MKKLGLNPKEIKYTLVTHGHSDHYGGSQFIKDKYSPDAKIAMNLVDKRFLSVMPHETKFGFTRPKVDMGLEDGQLIKLGDTTVQILLTPGHTPGSVSMIVPVTDNGTLRKNAEDVIARLPKPVPRNKER
ncbi:Hydroxyacylglutathione hydrolase [Sporomusa acidovorans DSM 3132]|uniref:Hydroxyacylglutathione hydrolase n=2 Tax=Sporomusa TaxID=2375 RepID=A0ABZ3J1I8_SPOA4|nr:metallo-beta-lactamase L1 precursor [Sporomusa acidovorans DSM 3132]SDF83618.1 Metallo-beta-lactamase superfamily protein [Sporomusa acidovorans]